MPCPLAIGGRPQNSCAGLCGAVGASGLGTRIRRLARSAVVFHARIAWRSRRSRWPCTACPWAAWTPLPRGAGGRGPARSLPVVPRVCPRAVVGKEAPTRDRVCARPAAVLLPPLMQPGCHGSAGLSKEAVRACGAHTRVGARTPRHAHTHACTHAHATRGPGEERRRWLRAAVPRTTRGTAGGWVGGVRAAEPSWDPLPIPLRTPPSGESLHRGGLRATRAAWTGHDTTRHDTVSKAPGARRCCCCCCYCERSSRRHHPTPRPPA